MIEQHHLVQRYCDSGHVQQEPREQLLLVACAHTVGGLHRYVAHNTHLTVSCDVFGKASVDVVQSWQQ